jgi:hypothetical protein
VERTEPGAWSRRLAAQYLDVPEFRDRLWRHVQAVGQKAEHVAGAFGPDAELVAASAWVHDIGYAPDRRRTGFHPLDGATRLEALGADGRLRRGLSGGAEAGGDVGPGVPEPALPVDRLLGGGVQFAGRVQQVDQAVVFSAAMRGRGRG